jgi:YD repeat-containing protein
VYTRTLPDGTKINFNSSGQETSVVDTDGNITSYSYTGGLLTGITDLDGQTTTLTYTGGKLTSILDPAGRSATLAYSGNQLTSITDAGTNLWKYAYDTSNDLTALTDPNNTSTGFSTNFSYSTITYRVNSATMPDNTFVSLSPQQTAQGQVAGADQALYTDANNKVWSTGLDWLGFGADVQDMDPLGDTALTYVDANGLPWMTSDNLGERERLFFDIQGNVTKDVAPDDSFWQYSYNNFSEVTQATDPTGGITSYTYNANGDLIRITDALLNITTLTYNTKGFVTSIEDPLLNTTTFGYNTLNLLTTITNALTQSATFAYNSANELTSSTDARGFVSTFAYNALGWMTGETLPITGTTNAVYTFGYDKVGNQTGETTPSGDAISYGFDVMNRLTSMNDPAVGLTTLAYNAVGVLLSVMLAA